MNEKELVEKLMLAREELRELRIKFHKEQGQHDNWSDYVAKAQLHKALTTPITTERECPECDKGYIKKCRNDDSAYDFPCHTCNGKGKVKRETTLKLLVEEWLK